MEIMTRAGFRCVAPDFRGFGDSASPGDDPGQFTVTEMANDVAALNARLGLGPHVLIGHSMGGKVALAVAAQQPNRRGGIIPPFQDLRALVLLAPSPPTPEPMPDAERARLLAAYGDRAAAEETVSKITARPLPDVLCALAVADILRSSQPAWRAWLEHGSRENIAAALQNVRVPVFTAVGAGDQMITAPLAKREIVARLGSSALVRVIGGAGHLLPLEAPASIANFIFECVVEADSARPARHRIGSCPKSPGR